MGIGRYLAVGAVGLASLAADARASSTGEQIGVDIDTTGLNSAFYDDGTEAGRGSYALRFRGDKNGATKFPDVYDSLGPGIPSFSTILFGEQPFFENNERVTSYTLSDEKHQTSFFDVDRNDPVQMYLLGGGALLFGIGFVGTVVNGFRNRPFLIP